jgi:thiol-disulfide isomerase/thioredoxin
MDPASASARPRVVRFVTRSGCHLCDEARPVVLAVARDTGSAVVELDVDDDDALFAAYGDLVPVVLVDGNEVARWAVDPARLRAALLA